MKEYYDNRAAEYDEWYLGDGRFADLKRPGWDEELAELRRALASLPPSVTLDVACGTAFLTRELRGRVTGLDQSQRMLEIARARLPGAGFLCADALALPFADRSFERIFSAHFYGHLRPADRERFLAEARRVAPQLVLVDSALRPDKRAEEEQERVLNDGSRFEVFKRYFTAPGLCEELGGGAPLYEGRWFVLVRSP